MYCGAAGIITLALCVPFTRLFEIPLALTAGIGAATLARSVAVAAEVAAFAAAQLRTLRRAGELG